VKWALAAVHADRLTSRYIHTLSDGEYQRVVLARALAQQTPMILLDEPTAFLDLPHRIEIMQILKNLVDSCHMTLVMSTHDIDLALAYASHFWLMQPEGHFVSGFPEDLLFSGDIEACLGSEHTLFDRDRGTFRAKPNFDFSVRVVGDRTVCRWVQNVLEKHRIGVSDSSDKAELTVEVPSGTDASLVEITCRSGSGVTHCSSYAQLDLWCRNLRRARAVASL
jgi:iron complex transport system ATP-binding protein